MDMTNWSEKEEVNDDPWTLVASPNTCRPSVHTPYPSHVPNPYEILDDESIKTHITASLTVSAETEINEPTPPSSIAAIVSPSSKFVKGIVAPPESHLHQVRAVPGSKLSKGQPFQCVKCKGTFQGEKFRCILDITTIQCSYVLCSTCQKAKLKEQKSSVPTSMSAHVTPTTGGNVTIAPGKSPVKSITPVKSPVKSITISDVKYVSTPTPIVLKAGAKRNASPHVNDPVDKCLKETVVPEEVQSPIRMGVTMAPETSQTHLQTSLTDLKKTQF